MTITQTSPISIGVDIPASRRLTIEVPSGVPVGRVVLTFTPVARQEPADAPAADAPAADAPAADGECPICAAHRDPVTGEELFNAETIAAIEEGRAMMRGEIPAKRFKTVAEMFEDLDRDDPDDDLDD